MTIWNQSSDKFMNDFVFNSSPTQVLRLALANTQQQATDPNQKQNKTKQKSIPLKKTFTLNHYACKQKQYTRSNPTKAKLITYLFIYLLIPQYPHFNQP